MIMKYFLCLCLFLNSFTLSAQRKHHINWWFVARTGLNIVAASFDVEGTQHCLNKGTCLEANPLMPTQPKFAWSLSMSLVGVDTTYDVLCLKAQKDYCWLPTTLSVAEHTAGAISGWTK